MPLALRQIKARPSIRSRDRYPTLLLQILIRQILIHQMTILIRRLLTRRLLTHQILTHHPIKTQTITTTSIPVITVDAQGRLTYAANVAISIPASYATANAIPTMLMLSGM